MTQTAPPSLPPGRALYQLSIGHYVSRALALAAKLGIADRLRDGARSAAELAQLTGTHAPSLARVLRLLVSVGVFAEQESGQFSLTPIGDALREDAPGSARATVLLFAGVSIQDNWKDLEYCVRTGEPCFKKYDPNATAFSEMQKDPEGAANFDKAMATFAPQTSAAVAAAYDFSRFGTLMDVGGGNGALLVGILRANPKLRGIVFDQPEVAARAKANLDAALVSERCAAIGGSFFERVPRGADAILLKHVIHDWNDAQATQILANCRAALPTGGRLLIVEGLYPTVIDGSLAARGATANDVNMLVVAGGRQRSEAEFRSLYAGAGLELARVIPTATGICVVESEPI